MALKKFEARVSLFKWNFGVVIDARTDGHTRAAFHAHR